MCFENEKDMNVAPDGRLRPFYEKPPFYLHFLAYVFNVTNKDEVIQGSELRYNQNYSQFFNVRFFLMCKLQNTPVFFFTSLPQKNQNLKKSDHTFLSE